MWCWSWRLLRQLPSCYVIFYLYDQETKSGFTPSTFCFHIVYCFQWACLVLSLALLLIYSHHCIWSCKDLTSEPSTYLSLYFIDVFLKWDNFWAQGNGVSLIKDSYNLLLIWHTFKLTLQCLPESPAWLFNSLLAANFDAPSSCEYISKYYKVKTCR
jgi:hypothetical protein